MYSTQAGGGEYLMAVTTDGRIKQRLTSNSGDIREPAWGPYPEVAKPIVAAPKRFPYRIKLAH